MHTTQFHSLNPTSWKLDKILGKLTKEICNIPKSSANNLTHLTHKNFGIGVFSLLPDYIHCIG